MFSVWSSINPGIQVLFQIGVTRTVILPGIGFLHIMDTNKLISFYDNEIFHGQTILLVFLKAVSFLIKCNAQSSNMVCTFLLGANFAVSFYNPDLSSMV